MQNRGSLGLIIRRHVVNILAAICIPSLISCSHRPPTGPERKAAPLALPCTIQDFISHSPSLEIIYRRTDCQGPTWQVVSKDDALTVQEATRYGRVHEPGPQPAFSFPRTLGDMDAQVLCHRMNDGWLIARDVGEFGAELDWYSVDGTEAYKVSDDHINEFFLRDGELFALSGLSHLG